MPDSLLISGRLVLPDGMRRAQVRFAGPVIAEIGDALGVPDVTYGDECLVFAGMGDIHIHARDDVSEAETYKEDFETVSAAALHGGVVHVADMPNNKIA